MNMENWEEQLDNLFENTSIEGGFENDEWIDAEPAKERIKQFISSSLFKEREEERERIIKLIKEKGLHLGYKNDIITLISSENK